MTHTHRRHRLAFCSILCLVWASAAAEVTAVWPAASGTDASGAWADLRVERGATAVTQRFRRIPAGTYLRGSPPDEAGRVNGEDQHQVTLTQDFWLADTECSQALWQAVQGSLPVTSTGNPIVSQPAQPVTWVSWNMATDFCADLQDIIGATVRLPTEAEWEYAARAGTTGPFSLADHQITTDHLAVRPYGIGANADPYIDSESGDSRGGPVDVGSLVANPWGLHEIHGNVLEWVLDKAGAYPTTAQIDPVNEESPSSARIQRGGDFKKSAQYARSATRLGASPGLTRNSWGFRLAIPADAVTPERRISLQTTEALPTHATDTQTGAIEPLPHTFTAPDPGIDRLFTFTTEWNG